LEGAGRTPSRRYLLANHLPLIPLAKRPFGAVLLFPDMFQGLSLGPVRSAKAGR